MESLSAEITNLLIQVPLVGIFIWFVLKYSERMQATMDKVAVDNQNAVNRLFDQMRTFISEQRNEDREARTREREITQQFFSQITDQLSDMGERQNDHFHKTDIAVASMFQRTGTDIRKMYKDEEDKEK